jgi:hypothetical protein
MFAAILCVVIAEHSWKKPWGILLNPLGQPLILVRDPQNDGFRLGFLHTVRERASFYGAQAPNASV